MEINTYALMILGLYSPIVVCKIDVLTLTPRSHSGGTKCCELGGLYRCEVEGFQSFSSVCVRICLVDDSDLQHPCRRVFSTRLLESAYLQ